MSLKNYVSVFIVSICVFILIFAVLAIARDFRSSLNRIFALMSVIVAGWIASNYFGSNYNEWSSAELLIRLDFFLAPFIPFFYFLLAERFAKSSNKELRRNRLVRYLVLSMALLGATLAYFPQNATLLRESPTEVTVEYGVLFIVYSLAIPANILISLWLIIRAYRNSSGRIRVQLGNLLFVTFLMLAIPSIANLLVPFLTDSEAINLNTGNLAYIGPAIFVYFAFSSLISNKLLNIRLATARAVGYSLALGALVLMTVSVGILVFVLIFHRELSATTVVTIAISVILLSIAYPYIKQFFSKLTSGIFKIDYYTLNAALLDVNQIFVFETELNDLVRKSIHKLNSYIHSQNIVFYGEIDGEKIVISTESVLNIIPGEEFHKIRFAGIKHVLDPADDMYAAGFEMIYKIRGGENYRAYLIFGTKKSGSLYTKMDLQFIEIFMNNFNVAINNACNLIRIKSFNKQLRRQVEEATLSLRKSNERLRTTNRSKDEFISMAAHQIRPQLTAVRGFVDLLTQSKIDDSQQEILNWMSTGVERMIRIISDMLNLSRVTSGEFKLNVASVDLKELAESEIIAIDPLRKTADIEIYTDFPSKKIRVLADDIKVREVIANLLSNAIQYSGNSKRIDVTVEAFENGFRFFVRDFGIGVPDNDEHKLFHKFFRSTLASEARPAGTGVGLFLAKKVISGLGGKVIFERPEDGPGSIFGFWLPAVDSPKKAE